MVLPSRNGCPGRAVRSPSPTHPELDEMHLHRGHLSQRQNDETKSNEGPDVSPKEPGQPAINKPLGVGQQEIFPNAGQNNGKTQRR